MKDPSRKSASSKRTKNPYPKDKPKVDHDTPSFFEKAKSLFTLDKRANAATERAWEGYIANRLAAEKQFHGARKIKSDDNAEEGDEDSWDEEEYDTRGGELDYLYALNMIRRRMACMEKEMNLDEGVLSRSFRVQVDCDELHFKREERPRTVATLTRIYSPTRPVYIDVRFRYHYQRRYYSTQWDYSLDFKIYNRPGVNDYKYSGGNEWRSIAYGSYGDCGRSGKRWVKAEDAEVLLEEEDVKDAYEALWGPMDDIQGDDKDKEERDRRSKMVNTIRVLMAAVGIGYIIAINDDEKDDAGKVFKLEGLDDRWFGRGIRKACGFQLARDPEEEEKGIAAREAERNRSDFPDEEDSDGMYYDEGDPSNSESGSGSGSGSGSDGD